MKVIGVICNSRPNSSSGKIVREILRGAEDAGHETVIYVLKDNLKGCIGCNCCKSPQREGFCVQQDILTPYFEDLKNAGAVVVGAAVYMGYPQGEAFTFMNRHYCLHAGDKVDGKPRCRIEAGKLLLPVISQGAPDNPKYQANNAALTRPFAAWGFEVREPMIISQAMGGVTEEALARAYETGKAL